MMKTVTLIFSLLSIFLMGCGSNRLTTLTPSPTSTSNNNVQKTSTASLTEADIIAPAPIGRNLQPQLLQANIPLDDITALLPPDAIPAVLPDEVDSLLVSARIANDNGLDPETRVIGISINGESHAYPIPFMSSHEIVNDEVGGRKIAATWWPLCYTGIVYDREISADTTLTFGVSGMLYQNGLIMYDHQTESLWSHILGQAIAGEHQGTSLTFIPALQTDWQTWQELHPDSMVINPQHFWGDSYRSYYADSKAGVLGSQIPRDGDIHIKEYVVGVRLEGQARAYPFFILNKEPVVNDQIGSIPIVVFFDKGTASATVFVRELADGSPLTFNGDGLSHEVTDAETGSKWHIFSGKSTNGPLQETQLAQVPITYAFWFGWADYHGEDTAYLGSE